VLANCYYATLKKGLENWNKLLNPSTVLTITHPWLDFSAKDKLKHFMAGVHKYLKNLATTSTFWAPEEYLEAGSNPCTYRC